MGKQRQLKPIVVCAILVSAVAMTTFFNGKPPQHPPTPPATPSQPVAVQPSDPSSPFAGTVFASDEQDSAQPWKTEKSAPTFFSRHLTKHTPVRKGLKDTQYVTINNRTYPLRAYYPLSTPNDPLPTQWWTTNTHLDQAWDIATGSYQTTLAIIDTGFALNHEDLQGRWYQNAGEVGSATSEAPSKLNCTARSLALDYACNLVDDDIDGIVDNESGTAPYENPSQLNCTDRGLPLAKECNLLDDDSNGYADDVRGWDVVNQDSSVQAGELSPNSNYASHGTMVAGTAAATGNNAKGIAGVNWQTTILPIQALDDDGYGNTHSVGESIYYAIDRGADVINISLGATYQDDYVREAIEAATAAGITVIAAAGNDGCDCVSYPAKYAEVIAVSALDESGGLASFSSWGSSVDVIAPGTNYTLPGWLPTNQTSRYVSGVAGTSFSSPLVAGMAALIKSHQPSAQPLHIISALNETSSRTGLTMNGTRSPYYGFGKLDAFALRSRMTTARHTLQAYVLSPVNVGNYFAGSQFESTGKYSIEDCHTGSGRLPVYELKAAGSTFFSISEVEVRHAGWRGYTPSSFAYACLQQPHDTADTIRIINIFREFKNLSSKQSQL